MHSQIDEQNGSYFSQWYRLKGSFLKGLHVLEIGFHSL